LAEKGSILVETMAKLAARRVAGAGPVRRQVMKAAAFRSKAAAKILIRWGRRRYNRHGPV
jgi:hypothetical protein